MAARLSNMANSEKLEAAHGTRSSLWPPEPRSQSWIRKRPLEQGPSAKTGDDHAPHGCLPAHSPRYVVGCLRETLIQTCRKGLFPMLQKGSRPCENSVTIYRPARISRFSAPIGSICHFDG